MLPEIPNTFNVYSIQKNFHPIEDTYDFCISKYFDTVNLYIYSLCLEEIVEIITFGEE